MSDELKKLIQEKKELERKIKLLESGAITNEMVKLDRINSYSEHQNGKWCVYYKREFFVKKGPYSKPKEATKWMPLFSGDTIEEAVGKIPDAVKALQELYNDAKGGVDGADS